MKANNEDIVIERTKNSNKKSGGITVIGIAVLVLILVMVICAAISHFSGMTVNDFDKNKANDGEIIYDSLPDSIIDIEKYASATVLLTDTSVDYLNPSGKRVCANAHSYSQPVIDVKNNTVFVYDKGGMAFRIEDNMSIYNSFTVNKPIVTASLGKKSNYAYVLNEDGGYQSHLYVYNLQGKKQFEWGSSADYCITTELSDNGKGIAIALLGVKNGEYVTTVKLFSFKEESPIFSVELKDCTVYELKFINSKTVAALTDNGIFVINRNGECEKICDYTPSEILHSHCSFRGLNAVCAAQHGNVKTTKLSVFNKKFSELYTKDFDTEIFSVRTSEKYVAALFNDSISIFDAKGNLTGNILFDEKCVDAAFSGNTLFVLTVSGIYSFNAHADYDTTEDNAQEDNTVELENTVEATTEESDVQSFG